MKVSKANQNAIVMILVAIALGFFFEYRKNKRLSRDQTYVVGEVTLKEYAPRGSAFVDFEYFYKKSKHKISIREEKLRVRMGERYIVSLPEGQEDDGIILYEYRVPDSVKVDMSATWDTIPNFVEKREVPFF